MPFQHRAQCRAEPVQPAAKHVASWTHQPAPKGAELEAEGRHMVIKGPEIQGGHLHVGSDLLPTLWARRTGSPPPGPCPRSLPPAAEGAGLHNGSQWGGGGPQMSPPPHSPRWRPGHHPGAGGRGTGLGPHHHHKGLHHPTHSQRRPGTWKGQRGCEGDVMRVGHGGCVPEPAKLKKSGQTPCWAIRQRGRRTGREGTTELTE